MTEYMDEEDIQDYLQEGFDEHGSIEKAFDYLLENEIRELFEMNTWDEPKFTELIIPFNKRKYKIEIHEDGCCESTNDHRIMYWLWTITAV